MSGDWLWEGRSQKAGRRENQGGQDGIPGQWTEALGGCPEVTVQEWLRARKARLQNVGQKRERARQRGSRSKPAGQQRSKAKKSRIRLLQKKLMGAEYQRPAKNGASRLRGVQAGTRAPAAGRQTVTDQRQAWMAAAPASLTEARIA